MPLFGFASQNHKKEEERKSKEEEQKRREELKRQGESMAKWNSWQTYGFKSTEGQGKHVVLSTEFKHEHSYKTSVAVQSLLQKKGFTVYNPNVDMPACHGDGWKKLFEAELRKAKESGGYMIRNGDYGGNGMGGYVGDFRRKMTDDSKWEIETAERLGVKLEPMPRDLGIQDMAMRAYDSAARALRPA